MKARHHRARIFGAALGVAGVHAAPALCAWSPTACRWAGVRERLDAPGAVALTFDDGPHAVGTPATLAHLSAAGATATFFLVGEQVERDPAVAAEIVAAGHEVALHCHRHRNLLRLTPRQVRDDLLRAEGAIIDATGRAPRLYRPPYGVLNAAALVVARKRGWETVLWSRWGRDWRARATAATIAADATDGVRGGDVVLLHDADHYSAPGSWMRTVAALPRIVDTVRAADLVIGPVS